MSTSFQIRLKFDTAQAPWLCTYHSSILRKIVCFERLFKTDVCRSSVVRTGGPGKKMTCLLYRTQVQCNHFENGSAEGGLSPLREPVLLGRREEGSMPFINISLCKNKIKKCLDCQVLIFAQRTQFKGGWGFWALRSRMKQSSQQVEEEDDCGEEGQFSPFKGANHITLRKSQARPRWPQSHCA